MSAIKTGLLTQDNLQVYDLGPQDTEVIAVAGPDGYDPESLDIDRLPAGFRRIAIEEWQELHDVT